MDFATHADLTGRLHGLIILLDDQLTLDQTRFADELVDASEFGPALEFLADRLAENEAPIPDDVRRDFQRLSSEMGIVDRIMGPLGHCRPEGDA